MSIATNIKKKTEKGLIEYLAGETKLKDVAFFTKTKKLAVMGIGVVNPETVLQLEDWARKGVVATTLQRLAKQFDYVVIDAPAGLGSVSIALLNASQGVLLASQCRTLSLKTLPKMLSLITWVQKNANPDLILEGIILTMHHREDETETEILKEITTAFPADLFFSELISYDPIFEVASVKSIPVGMLKAGKLAAHNYFQLAIEYKQREMLLAQAKGDDNDADSGLF